MRALALAIIAWAGCSTPPANMPCGEEQKGFQAPNLCTEPGDAPCITLHFVDSGTPMHLGVGPIDSLALDVWVSSVQHLVVSSDPPRSPPFAVKLLLAPALDDPGLHIAAVASLAGAVVGATGDPFDTLSGSFDTTYPPNNLADGYACLFLEPKADSRCFDNALDGSFGETDVDCGGNYCPRCAADKICHVDTDCATGLHCSLRHCK
jgi:hypothetical protein